MVSRRTLRIGVIGLGWPGQMHAKAVLATRSATLHAIADTSPERRARHLKEHPAEKEFSGYEAMLADPDVDAVIICLPNFLHYPASLAALKAGKHVLCEKPPTMNAREMLKLKREAERRGLVYMFGRQARFSGEMIAARKLVNAGKLGEIYFARSVWLRNRGIPIGIGGWFLDKARAGGGAMIDIGIHTLDNAWFLMGSPRPLTVSAQVFQKFGRLVPDDIKNDVDDCGFAFIRFENGAVLSLETAWASNLPDSMIPEWNGLITCLVHGTKGALQTEPCRWFKGHREKVEEIAIDPEPADCFQLQLADFLRAIRTGGQPVSDAAHAVDLMEMLDAIYKSSVTGREVRIPRGRR